MMDAEPHPISIPGHVWAVRIYPGGRSQFVQAKPKWISTKEAAVDWIAIGSSVYVLPEDADEVLKGVKKWTQNHCFDG